METKNIENLIQKVVQNNSISLEDLAREITCSISTLKRLISKETFPTEKFIKEIISIDVNGFDDYKKISLHRKSKVPEKNGAIGGVAAGTVASTVGITSIYGLSASGITGGLAAIGGTMVAGVATLVAAPLAIGVLGYGVVRSYNSYKSNKGLNKLIIDTVWEYK